MYIKHRPHTHTRKWNTKTQIWITYLRTRGHGGGEGGEHRAISIFAILLVALIRESAQINVFAREIIHNYISSIYNYISFLYIPRSD